MTYLKKIKLNFFEVVHKSPSVISVSPPHSFVSFAGHCNPKLLAYNQRRRRHLTCHLMEVTERMGCSHLCFTHYRNDGLMTSPQQHKESTKRVLAEHALNFEYHWSAFFTNDILKQVETFQLLVQISCCQRRWPIGGTHQRNASRSIEQHFTLLSLTPCRVLS